MESAFEFLLDIYRNSFRATGNSFENCYMRFYGNRSSFIWLPDVELNSYSFMIRSDFTLPAFRISDVHLKAIRAYAKSRNAQQTTGTSYIRTAYSYAPFGDVTESGDVTQPFQWSSEVYDSELDLVYYNFRHYSPSLGRFLSRDPIAEQGGRNLYAFVKNNPIQKWDRLGRFAPIPGCHLNSPTCGGNGTIFQPVDISIQPGGYLDAFSLFLEWLSGVHQNPTVEEINSPRSMELSQSDGGRYFVDFVKRKYNGLHCDKWDLTDDFDYNFRDPYRFVVNLPYGIAHFVGSFQDGVSTVYSRDVKNCKITMLFSVDNYSTWESFLYGATTFFDDSQSLGKTWKQTYR